MSQRYLAALFLLAVEAFRLAGDVSCGFVYANVFSGKGSVGEFDVHGISSKEVP
jgi:hypothetical protein